MRSLKLIAPVGLFLVGATITGMIRSAVSEPDPATTTTPTTTVALATWQAPAELIVPPVVVVPRRIEHDGPLVVVDYDLVSMAVGDDPAVRPTAWTLEAGDAQYEAEIDAASTRVAFDVGLDFSPAAITGLRLDEYVLRSPIQASFEPSPDDFSTHPIAPGVTAALDIVQDQPTGSIVRVRVAAAIPGATADLAADGIGQGWVSASSNFGGGGLWTLSFEGTELPDPLPLMVQGLVWIPVEIDLTTTLEGVPIE